ncbi:hypothetical protein O3P69_000869 [Scylla paramamosain]|uniref:Uncharacterized protein n=1 Tax=Scylla paramamosain TaxID=85552 RepID=A0AAW0UTM7_SCYPA
MSIFGPGDSPNALPLFIQLPKIASVLGKERELVQPWLPYSKNSFWRQGIQALQYFNKMHQEVTSVCLDGVYDPGIQPAAPHFKVELDTHVYSLQRQVVPFIAHLGVAFPDVHPDANPIPCVDIAKVVGLVMNSNLTWQDHVDHIVKKASKLFFMLFKARSFGATQQQLVQLYCQRIRPVLEYACPVWHPGLTTAQRTTLERVQKRVCRVILGGSYNSYTATLTTFGQPSLEDRRGQLTLSFGEKMKENDHLQLLPQRAPSRYQTRHSARLPPVRCRTERYRNSTIPCVTRLANK